MVTTVAAFPRQYCDLQVERMWFSNHQCSFLLLWIHHADAVWFFHLIDENSRFFHGNADQLGWGPVYLGNQLQQAGLGFYGILDYMEDLICFHPSTEAVKKIGNSQTPDEVFDPEKGSLGQIISFGQNFKLLGLWTLRY